MLNHYHKFWLNAKLKVLLTTLITTTSIAQVSEPGLHVTLSSPVTTATKVTATNTPALSRSFSANTKPGSFKARLLPPPLLPCLLLGATPSSDQNYVITYTPSQPFTDTSLLKTESACHVMENIQYLDGLGRPIQNVQVRGNPDASKDVIQPIAYDEFGRENKKYLSYTDGTNTIGSYRSNALLTGVGQSDFYANPPTGSGVTRVSSPFAETQFDASPLNRVVEQGAPGTDWQLSAGHAVITSYDVNIAGDVQRYLADNVTTPGQEYKRYLTPSGYYDAGELYRTTVKNENWVHGEGKKNTTEEYTDKKGRLILKRVFDDNETPLSTYYVYDYRNNLTFVLPPGANADSGSVSQNILDNLCYQYFYDGRKRLIEKKSPGTEWNYMIYNSQDQLVATQDGWLRENFYPLANRWKFIKYDEMSRPVITGTTVIADVGGVVQTRKDIQAAVDLNTNVFETRDPGSGYTNVAWPSTYQVLTSNYYDNYDIPGMPYDHHTENSTMTKGLLTVTQTNVLYTNDFLWTVNYYDDLGRPTNVYAQHYLKGTSNLNVANYDHVNSSYNFNNQVISSTRTHYTVATAGTAQVTVANSYIYDHVGRKKQTWSQINTPTVTGTNILLSRTLYNDIGQLLTKSLHSEDGTSFLQDINYVYNERGWITHIGSTLFDEQLNYNTQTHGATVQYNGNVAEQIYTTPAPNNTKWVTYAYDDLNRLTAGTSSAGFSETGIDYDKMGNIKHLKRGTNTTTSYSYLNSENSNQLASVSGGINSSSFLYDGNGNLVLDERDDKSIETDYNILNLPGYVGGSQDMQYDYSASGEKLDIIDNQTGINYYYDKGIEYSGTGTENIDYIQTEEGRAVPDGSGGFKYEYTLKDHLGNNRVNFDKDLSGNVREIQETDYYPFGLSVSIYNLGSSTNYLYNGKEEQPTFNEYDYGARYYDPALAKWKTMDPLADQYNQFSPYNYVMNNPLRYIDPDGMNSDDDGFIAFTNGLADSANEFQSDIAARKAAAAANVGIATFFDDGKLSYQTKAATSKAVYEKLGGEPNSNQARSYSVIGEDEGLSLMVASVAGTGLLGIDGFQHAADFASGSLHTPSSGGLSPTSLISWGNLVSDFTKRALINSGKDADILVGARFASQRLGQAGVVLTAVSAIRQPGGATWGDVAKVAIGAALVISPVGWFTLGYAAIDITLSLTTGAGLTDRIGSGVNNILKN